jgi:hypothetical protein
MGERTEQLLDEAGEPIGELVVGQAADLPPTPRSGEPGLPFSAMSEYGLLWLINRVVFHPRGYALAFWRGDDGEISGWSIIGDGQEVWTFKADDDDEEFDKAARTFRLLDREVTR